jgi:hypothetical protein
MTVANYDIQEKLLKQEIERLKEELRKKEIELENLIVDNIPF